MSEVLHVDLEDLTSEDDFRSWGYCHLKVQKGDVVQAVRVKVSSIDQDVFQKMAESAPRPPSKLKLLDPNTEEGKQFGVTTKTKANVYDYADENFQKTLREHNRKWMRTVVGMGVHEDHKLKLKNGQIADTPELRAQVLEEMRFTDSHFTEIFERIQSLTKWSEDEREAFLQ